MRGVSLAGVFARTTGESRLPVLVQVGAVREEYGMNVIKEALKHTPVYGFVRYLLARRSLRAWTVHDQGMTDFYANFVSPGELVFDVGANIGNRTKIFLKLGARVVAVEPQDECLKVLHAAFDREDVVILDKVLGASEGQGELLVSAASTVSSLSRDWIRAVKESGRFSALTWEKKKRVAMTTLDHLIGVYGTPAFIKIDVEGFEHEVIRGLGCPVKYISFEFTPEFIGAAVLCVDHLAGCGDIVCNYSLGESMRLALDQYVAPHDMKEILCGLEGDHRIFGDVYCRAVGEGAE